jgi:hypothetical protein
VDILSDKTNVNAFQPIEKSQRAFRSAEPKRLQLTEILQSGHGVLWRLGLVVATYRRSVRC